MSLLNVCIFQLILFLYEYLAWQLEIKNYTTHSHHRQLFGTNAYFLTVQINSLPHLAAAYVYYHRIKWAMLLYIPYLMLFTVGQIFTWWLPYFFRKGLWYMDESGKKLEQYQQYHAHHHRILPPFRDHEVIPDTEHTILFVLTCITFILTIRSVISAITNKSFKIKIK
ncbi:hypothetical protein I4U23_025472 [Adineta vaga]|nr:hypothetical protein I4U23_025472 [Adineta vaga]